jgi:hypothetical protein
MALLMTVWRATGTRGSKVGVITRPVAQLGALETSERTALATASFANCTLNSSEELNGTASISSEKLPVNPVFALAFIALGIENETA